MRHVAQLDGLLAMNVSEYNFPSLLKNGYSNQFECRTAYGTDSQVFFLPLRPEVNSPANCNAASSASS